MKLFLTVFIILLNHFAYAISEAETSTSVISVKADEISMVATEQSGASKFWREKKRSGIAVSLVPVSFESKNIYGVEYYRNLSSSFQLGIDYKRKRKIFAENNGYFDINQQIQTTQILTFYNRYFLGNSFALKSGLRLQQSINLKRSHLYNDIPPEETRSDIFDWGLEFSIGNFWSFKSGLYYGFDWFTYYFPFVKEESYKITSYRNLNGDYVVKRKETANKFKGDKIFAENEIYLFSAFIGYTF